MRHLTGGLLALGLLAVPNIASASLLVDRGLPTANLNNAAGSNRSNVAWADGPVPYFFGDNFTLAGGAESVYSIDTIRTWVVSSAANITTTFPNVTLFTGIGTSLSVTATSATITPVTYQGGASYQGTSGSFFNIYEVDFTGLNIVADGGTTVAFGVEGTGTGANWFNHASNAALSGSPQDSADNLINEYSWDGNIADAPVFLGPPFDTNQPGVWDKSSDINVQVFGTVPEPASLSILAVSALGLGLVRRRRQQ